MINSYRSKPGFKKNIQPQVIHQDTDIIVVNKPVGMLTQSDDSGDLDLQSWIRGQLKHRIKSKIPFVGIVHRIDRPVSGLVLMTLNSAAASNINHQLRNNSFKKQYKAIVHGTPPRESTWHDYLLKDERTRITRVCKPEEMGSKSASLSFRVIGSRSNRCLVEIDLKTGRSHQIRVQFASRGYPIVADRKYGSREVLRDPGMIALWAFQIDFRHPQTGRPMKFTSPKPPHWPWYEK